MQLVSSRPIPPVSDLKEEARRRLASRDPGSAFAVTFSLAKLDPTPWLHAQSSHFSDRFFWHGREEPGAVAAVGRAYEVSGLPDQPALEQLGPEARLYGAGSFYPPGDEEGLWVAFGEGRFVLPRVELRTERETSELRIWSAPGENERIVDEALERLAWPPFQSASVNSFLPVSRRDIPVRPEWVEQVESVLDEIASGRIGKVVLARRAVFSFEKALDPVALLERLIHVAPGAFYALIPDGKGRFFLTASPEQLVRISDGALHTEALAGTERVGEGGRSLTENGKDMREHAFVQDAVMETIAAFCSEVHEVESPSLFQAAHVHHLRTPISGTLLSGVLPVDIVRALHPTPAVGGTPTGPAMEIIQATEGFDRGLYAGPIGWISRDEADLAVGIRSGLVDGRDLVLHSGAGIVAGSVPAAEWEETELKLGAFLNALQLDV